MTNSSYVKIQLNKTKRPDVVEDYATSARVTHCERKFGRPYRRLVYIWGAAQAVEYFVV